MWQMMNVCALDYPDESFNAVVDKGTLDSVLCGEGSTANVAKMCMEISRVLKPNGVYFICSYGVPDNRLQVTPDTDYPVSRRPIRPANRVFCGQPSLHWHGGVVWRVGFSTYVVSV